MMRWWLVVILFLSACSIEKSVEIDHGNTIPSVIVLENSESEIVGKAIPFSASIYVAPDHLWQSAGELFFQGKPIEVLVRDFQHDVLFFEPKQSGWYETPLWKDNPPAVGEVLSWFDGFQLHKVKVVGSEETFFSYDEITNLMSVETVLEPGDSGSPLFDEMGNIYGMLIGTDIEKNKSYFVRSDIIQDLAAEYLETK